MYSLLLCSAIALVLGFSGTLLDWWHWAWAILFSVLAFAVAWVLLTRWFAKRLQPPLARVQRLTQDGNLDGAMQGLESMLPICRWVPLLKGQLLAQMGMLANFQGDQPKAITLLGGASLRSPDARLVLGCIHYRQGDSKRAIEILRLAAAINKKHALLHNTYAWMLHKSERGDEAQAVLAAYLKRDPNNGPSKENLLRLQNRTRMTMQGFDMQWYALGLERPPQAMGQMRRAPKGFREPPKQRG
ncbi:MAG: tetratricopeptide repeat protein [Planctomycetes bacterium]|nr:tetratricopeptide repeat protein [Planctomycetota bacterium]